MTEPTRLLCRGAFLLAASLAEAGTQDMAQAGRPPANGPVYVSEPAVPTITVAVKDLPDWQPNANLFGLEMKRREDFGFVPTAYPIAPQIDPLFRPQGAELRSVPGAFGTPVYNYPGQTSSASPPDANGDVGPNHYVQAVNQSVSTVRVLSKTTGENLKTFTMQSLTADSPCRNGFCDSVVLYDRAADRWLISELPSSGGNVCVYVSTSGDPTGTWYAYTFAVASSLTDFPKYGVWPQGGNGGSYLMGANAGAPSVRDIFAFDRAKMLAGLPATFQKFSVPRMPNSGFQLVLPSTLQGATPPPDGEPAVFMRPRDDEAQSGASTPGYDWLDMWQLRVDWATPANSTLAALPPAPIADYDMTLCGMGGIWNCMPQPGTTQKIDPIREPLHFPLQYRNFGTHQTLVGTFPVDVDATDHAAMRWFELRKTGTGAWTVFQQGLVGGEAGVHRSVGSIAMDGSGNMALAYTRTGMAAPYYPSIYYSGRLASDTPGTMPHGEFAVIDATTSKTGNERWGDYAAMAIDPADDCTFWFTSQYGGSGTTRVAAFKFAACGCVDVPAAPRASASAPQGNRVAVSWNDSLAASIVQYLIFRSTTAGGPFVQIAAVADTSPGTGGGASYTYEDDTVSGGTRYFYYVQSTDGGSCVSSPSNEVDVLATGQCLLAPSFAGAAAVDNAGSATCSLNVSWNAAVSNCAAGVSYNVYRSTTSGFTPSSANRIAAGVTAESYVDSIGITGNTSYSYVVRAVDGSNGAVDGNLVQKTGVPTGPVTMTSWTDAFEGAESGGGFDRAGWSRKAIAGSTNWTQSTAQVRDGVSSWFAADVGSVSDKVLVSPPFGVGPATTLSFWHTYRFEGTTASCYDGGTLEFTTNGGATWTVVPAGSFVAGGYTGTVNSGWSNPIGGKSGWCAGTIGPMTQVVVNLGGNADLVNRTVQIRWHEGDDNGTSAAGWYVDAVAVANAQTAGACTVGAGILTVSSNSPICEGATLDLSASHTQAGVSYSWTGPNGFSSPQQNPTIPGASPASSGTYAVTVRLGSTTLATEATALAVLADGASCSDGNACTTGDTCAGAICSPGSPATCDDSNPCTTDSCNPASGCAFANNSAPCNDGDACTSGDICGGGHCIAGAPVACDDGNVCTTDSCHPGSGCAFANNSAPCNDGDACTSTDTCSGGSCAGGTPVGPPVGPRGLVFEDTVVSWSQPADAIAYDVLTGTLADLRDNAGFAGASVACEIDDGAATSFSMTHVPGPGEGAWILVRAVGACGTASYDDRSPTQRRPRDADISTSANACP